MPSIQQVKGLRLCDHWVANIKRDIYINALHAKAEGTCKREDGKNGRAREWGECGETLSSGDSTRELTTGTMVTRIRPTHDQANQISQHYHQQAALTSLSGLQRKGDDVKSGKETHWGCLVEKGGVRYDQDSCLHIWSYQRINKRYSINNNDKW